MTDLFEHWRQSKFVVASDVLVDEEKLVILTDIQYWADRADQLQAWCSERNAVTEGMTVVFGDEKTLVEFMLKWS